MIKRFLFWLKTWHYHGWTIRPSSRGRGWWLDCRVYEENETAWFKDKKQVKSTIRYWERTDAHAAAHKKGKFEILPKDHGIRYKT